MRDRPMLKPAALRPGDRVAIVAPASPFPLDEFEAGVEEVRRLGFEPVYDEAVFDRHRYLAGDVGVRAGLLLRAWQDPAIAAILTARGGYGSVQVLPLLKVDIIRRRPKIFVGYSDITAILSYLTTTCGVTAIHGPTIAGRLGRGAAGYDRDSFLRALTRPEPAGPLSAAALETIAVGEASGPIFGGNLTQLAASLGTPYAFDPPEGCILFLEDINERPYRVDRLLTQLQQSGILARAAALVFGEMPGCDEADGAITCREVVAEFVRGFDGPVLWGLPSGHTSGAALTLPLGVDASVKATASGPRLVIEESAVV